MIFFSLKKKHFLHLKRNKDAHFPLLTRCTQCFLPGVHPINWSDSRDLMQQINNSSKRNHCTVCFFYGDLSPPKCHPSAPHPPASSSPGPGLGGHNVRSECCCLRSATSPTQPGMTLQLSVNCPAAAGLSARAWL